VLAGRLSAGAELAGCEEAEISRLKWGHADMIADTSREARSAGNVGSRREVKGRRQLGAFFCPTPRRALA
jgi:hypothetical protein